MEQVHLAVNLHSRLLLIQKRRSHKNAVEAISRLHRILSSVSDGGYSLIVLPLDNKVRQICI